jgi:transposase
VWPLDGCSSRDLSAQLWAAAPARVCFGGLIRSLPDSLPRVVARYRPASKCLLPGRRRYDVAYRKEPNVAMPIVAEQYTFVIGVDTHAATHSLALVIAATGAVVDEAVFPNTPLGLDRALSWITRRIAEQSALVVIEGVGSYGAGLAQRVTDAGVLVAEPSEMPASTRRGVGKTDSLDAVRIARSVLAVDTSRLRWPRAAGQRVVLRVLVVAREQMVTERTRAINALTALLRTIDLGVDTRKALPHRQFKVIAGWRDRREDSVVRTCRHEAIRLAKRIVALNAELVDNRKALDAAVEDVAPELCELPGVGSVIAACVLTAWSHPGRVRFEAAFAALAGTCPIPASSGNTLRHRLNRGGDRRLNRALTTVVIVRMRTHAPTRAYVVRRRAEGRTTKEIMRSLKRYITRQLFRTLASAHPIPTTP